MVSAIAREWSHHSLHSGQVCCEASAGAGCEMGLSLVFTSLHEPRMTAAIYKRESFPYIGSLYSASIAMC